MKQITRQDSTLPSSTAIVNRSGHLLLVSRLQGSFSDFSSSPVSNTSWSRSLFRTYPKAIFRARARIGPWWGVISDPLYFGPYLWLHVRLESCLPVARTETVCQTDPAMQGYPDYRLKTPRPLVGQTCGLVTPAKRCAFRLHHWKMGCVVHTHPLPRTPMDGIVLRWSCSSVGTDVRTYQGPHLVLRTSLLACHSGQRA